MKISILTLKKDYYNSRKKRKIVDGYIVDEDLSGNKSYKFEDAFIENDLAVDKIIDLIEEGDYALIPIAAPFDGEIDFENSEPIKFYVKIYK